MQYLSCILLLMLTGSAWSHESFFGRCPSSPAMEEFDMEKFEGVWYVIESFDDYLKCVMWNITKGDKSGVWKLNETKESGTFHALGIKPNLATVTEPDSTHPAKLRIQWPLSIAGSSAFTVYKTDYDNFAGLFECQNVGLFHRQNGVVLSRTPVLKVDLKQMARIGTDSIKVAYYRPVSQANCQGRASSDDLGTQWVGVPGDTYLGDRGVTDHGQTGGDIPDVEVAVLDSQA